MRKGVNRKTSNNIIFIYVYNNKGITLNQIVSKMTDKQILGFSPFKTLKYWTKNVSSKTRGKLNERNINRLNDYIVTMYYYIIR